MTASAEDLQFEQLVYGGLPGGDGRHHGGISHIHPYRHLKSNALLN